MSRIAGIVSKSGREYRDFVLSQMVAKQIHSGWKNVYLDSGDSSFNWCGWLTPNASEENDVLCVLDGHIYNRNEFDNSENDATIFSSLYKRLGFEEALRKINGDFAIAVYDLITNEIWVARDRFGLKPFYFFHNNGFFAFASRLSALLTLPGVSTEVNHRFVGLFAGCHYRYFDNNPDQSPYRDIFQLPASHLLCLQNGKLKNVRYWKLEDVPNFNESEDELAQRYRDLLLDAVSLRLKPAKKPSFTLSGGMDSSSVLASSVYLSGKKYDAFSTVYEDKTYDESNEIVDMLDMTVDTWNKIKIDVPDVLSTVEKMIAIHDEPVPTVTWLSHYLLCGDVSSKGFGSLFGGLGGDELNAGEYEHFMYYFADLKYTGECDQLKSEISSWIKYHDHSIFKKSFNVVNDGLSRLVNQNNPGECIADRSRLERYADAIDPDYFDLKEFDPNMEHAFNSYLKNRTYQDIFFETIPCCLRAEDRQTSAYSIDNFLPFFDHRLVEFMFRIPGTMKIRNGITKYLLREAMRGILPEKTRVRVSKSGWNAPAHVWFSGKGKECLMDMVSSRSFRERGIYNLENVNKIIDEHCEIVSSNLPKDNHMMFIWQIVNMEIWLNTLSENRKIKFGCN